MTLNCRINPPALTALTALAALCALLGACATSEPAPVTAAARPAGAKGKPQQLNFKLVSGTYRCELGQRIEIERNARHADLINLSWQGSRHTLQRADSNSGLPRYEDRQSGLLWIDLPWKSVLMDANSGRPLANECKASSPTRG